MTMPMFYQYDSFSCKLVIKKRVLAKLLYEIIKSYLYQINIV